MNNLVFSFLLDEPQEFSYFIQIVRREDFKMQWGEKEETILEDGVETGEKSEDAKVGQAADGWRKIT